MMAIQDDQLVLQIAPAMDVENRFVRDSATIKRNAAATWVMRGPVAESTILGRGAVTSSGAKVDGISLCW